MPESETTKEGQAMKTVTYDETKWQLVPKVLTASQQEKMLKALNEAPFDFQQEWSAVLAAAPTCK